MQFFLYIGLAIGLIAVRFNGHDGFYVTDGFLSGIRSGLLAIWALALAPFSDIFLHKAYADWSYELGFLFGVLFFSWNVGLVVGLGAFFAYFLF